MNISDLSASQLHQAAAIKEQIEKLQGDLATVLGTAAPAVSPAVPTVTATPKKQVVSAATPAGSAPVKKFTMSASAKAAISKAAKARWAKIRAAQKK